MTPATTSAAPVLRAGDAPAIRPAARRRLGLGTLVARLVLAAAALSALVPVLWTFLNSFKNRVDIVSSTPKFLFTPTLENYDYVLGREAVAQGLVNSLVVVGSAVLIGALLGLPAAYALARYPVRRADDIQFFVLSMRFLPPVAVAIPLMVIWLQLELYDTRIALIVTYTLLTLSTVIWLAIPAFKAVPREVEEAGRVDGYGPYAIFFKVALPIAARSLVGAIAFGFVLVWNEFLIALMLTTSDAKTLPIVASELSQLGRDVPWGILNASVILLSLPPLLMIGVLSGFLNAAFKRKRDAA
ncbi:carbohydrate ABC transporter permease [Variovorax sp. Varisp41]|uniref:carbohydrate ABC transporter permease n=1 Tax=Variovorax sp. Varisp41 TaxID=3243033 RepID=UPI0039B43F2B